MAEGKEPIEIGLNAAIVAMVDNDPCILRVPGQDEQFADALRKRLNLSEIE